MSRSGPGSTRRDGDAARPPVSEEVFSLLEEGRHKYVVHCLQRYGPVVSVDDVVEYVAEQEARNTVSPGTATQSEVRRALLGHHLPVLNTHGVVDYDSVDGTVAPGDHVELTGNYSHPLRFVP